MHVLVRDIAGARSGLLLKDMFINPLAVNLPELLI
jgi:hypothetical protein